MPGAHRWKADGHGHELRKSAPSFPRGCRLSRGPRSWMPRAEAQRGQGCRRASQRQSSSLSLLRPLPWHCPRWAREPPTPASLPGLGWRYNSTKTKSRGRECPGRGTHEGLTLPGGLSLTDHFSRLGPGGSGARLGKVPGGWRRRGGRSCPGGRRTLTSQRVGGRRWGNGQGNPKAPGHARRLPVWPDGVPAWG